MSLSVSYFMNKYYTNNRFGVKEDMRAGRDARTLANADMQALRLCLKDLRGYEYETDDKDEEDTTDLTKRVEAFVSTYNNFLDSAENLNDSTVDRYTKKVKNLTKEQAEAFNQIGITIQSSGKLKIDKEVLKEVSARKIQKLFGNETDYSTELDRRIKKTATVIRQRGIGIPSQKKAGAAKPELPDIEEPDADEDTDTDIDPDPDMGILPDPEQEEADEQLYEQLFAALNSSRINYSI